MNGLEPAQWGELKRRMKDGVPGLPISQGGNWDITEHGFGGLYGQTAFSSRPAGAPPVDPRFAPGAPLVAGLQPHYAVGAPAPASSSLGGAALPVPPAAPSAGGLPASVVSAFAPAPASFGAPPAPGSFSFGALPASLSGAPPVAPPSPAPGSLPPPPGFPPAGGLPAWAQDPALASFYGDPPDLNTGYEEQRAPPPPSLASLVSSPPRPPVVTQPRPTPYRDLRQARRDLERAANADDRQADADAALYDEVGADDATPVCPFASWVVFGLVGCVLLLLLAFLPSLVVFTTDTSFVSPTCPLSARQGIAATPAASGCTGWSSASFGARAGATSYSAVGSPVRGLGPCLSYI